MGADAAQRARILMWYMRIEIDGFTAVAESFRNFSRGFRGRALTGPQSHDQIPELVERGRKRTARFLVEMNEHLCGREYVVDDVFTLADIATLASIDFAGWIKMQIGEELSHLGRWYSSVSARSSAKL